MNVYEVVAKGHTDKEPRRFRVRTDAPARLGATFSAHSDGIVWLVGRMDGITLYCGPWFMQPTDNMEAELEPAVDE
jgi:hypothetical protein